MKKILGFLLLLSCSTNGFEIKTICPPLNGNGAYCEDANTKHINLAPNTNSCLSETSYALQGKNKPIHEAITKSEYKKVFGKELLGYNYTQPLIAGVVWNDDPQQLIRKVWHNDGVSKIIKFTKLIKNGSNDVQFTMTQQSHFGDMQFLHSMKPKSENKLSDDDVKMLIYDWIKNSYRVVTGEVSPEDSVKGTYFGNYFSENLGYYKIRDVFDPTGMYAPENTKLIASGTIIHLIQDSYSKSHVIREKDSWQLKEFYTYPNKTHDHCLSDSATVRNKSEIEMASKKTNRYLELRKEDADWCSKMAPFIKETFNIEAVYDSSCSVP